MYAQRKTNFERIILVCFFPTLNRYYKQKVLSIARKDGEMWTWIFLSYIK